MKNQLIPTEKAMKNQALSLEQIASICGVSLKLVRRWIEKKGLKVDSSDGSGEKVQHADMINFLVKYNMQIPDSIMPIKVKKILFIYSNASDGKLFLRFLINFLGQLKKDKHGFIADHIAYGPDAKMKVMVFKPDLIILDMTEHAEDAVSMGMLIKNTEEFNSINLVAVTGAELFERYSASAAKSGIDEVLIGSVETGPLAKRLMGFS
jgi:hypothetical protein